MLAVGQKILLGPSHLGTRKPGPRLWLLQGGSCTSSVCLQSEPAGHFNGGEVACTTVCISERSRLGPRGTWLCTRIPNHEMRAVGHLRNDGHVDLKLGQEAWETEWMVHANGFLQLLHSVGREGNAPFPGTKQKVDDSCPCTGHSNPVPLEGRRKPEPPGVQKGSQNQS